MLRERKRVVHALVFNRDVKNVIKQIKNVKKRFLFRKNKNVIKNVLLIAGYR